MKCLAAVVISMNAMVGVVSLQAGDEAEEKNTLPRGEVSVEEYVPTVLVEAKHWEEADELAMRQTEAAPRLESWVNDWLRRDMVSIFAR